jgi:ABC-2 type transport system ATP-binding protein
VLVAGLDVATQAAEVRRRIGMAGQTAALDYTLSGRENLVMFGRLQRLGRRQANRAADRLLTGFGLTDVAGKAVRTYSGGMARRLDLAAALIATPKVTLLLTTQYLEEADRLADHVAVVDHGRVITSGTPDELKRRMGGERIDVHLADPADLDRAVLALRPVAQGEPIVDVATAVVGVPAAGGASAVIAEVVRALDRHHIAMSDISTHRPTLDDVFLAVTGHGP